MLTMRHVVFWNYINLVSWIFHKLNSITMKYSVPGHSCVQEVDNTHSNIEKAMHVAEFYSPVSFLRVLLNCYRQRPYKRLKFQNKICVFGTIPTTKNDFKRCCFISSENQWYKRYVEVYANSRTTLLYKSLKM